MTFPSTLSFATVHDFFLGLLLDAHFSKFPPAEDYQRLFWKWAIANMECVFQSSLDDNDQVDDLEASAPQSLR
jgi:protein-lysine N-methyltransferase EEF2KMT